MPPQTRLRPADEIDTIVDDILRDPGRADELKRKLRRHVRVVAPPRRIVEDDLDELWDNVPL